jgi:aspartate beta-hydroxylase
MRDFAWVPAFEKAATTIKEEFQKLRSEGKLTPHPQRGLAGRRNRHWNTYYLYADGVRFHDHCSACPGTTAALEAVPGITRAGRVFFSVMAPGAHVRPHCGATNTRIRCHLGLVVPASSRMRVGTRMLQWQEGRCLMFDDSYEHEVWNPDAERAVLILDVWHPDLSEPERWAISKLARLSGRNRLYRRDIGRDD